MAAAVRRIGPGDAALLGEVAEDVFDDDIDPARLAAFLAAEGHLMVLALDGPLVVGQCRGMVHHNPDQPPILYVDNLGVAPTHRRRGIAGAMMAEIFAWGREQGCAEAWLGTETDNDEANGFYRRLKDGDGVAMFYYEFDLED